MQKTQKTITYQLSNEAVKWLPERGEGEFVFGHLTKKSKLCMVVRDWAKSAGIKKYVTFHMRSHSKIFYLLNISELSTLKNVTANDLETSYILFLSQLCNIQRTL